ncbi:hypothetical protein JL722_13980 [Aureococcus anophagefferens]|nr:hypothetical protein JL722_13980 [Aureococcus anophagefferens]
MFWDQEDVSDGGFDDGVDIERESAASTPSRPGSAGSFSPFDAAHASADEMLHQLRLDRAARPLGVTSLRRSSSSSCLAATATRSSPAPTEISGGSPARSGAAEASGLGAAVRVEAAGSAAEASAFLERLRPNCSSTSSSGSPRPSRDDELRWIRAAAAAGAAPPSAVVALDAAGGRPLSATAANELLWRHVFPFGACKINPTRPLSALLTEHGDRVGASLRDGGLRGLLGLLHGDRREASCALDRLIDGLDARGRPGAAGRTPAVLVAPEPVADAFGVSARVSVEIARDGVEAVRAVHDDVARRDTCFILVLLDLRMPNLDGASAARELRRAGSTAPLVAVTASALPGRTAAPAFDLAEDDAVALAFDDVITKPLAQSHSDARAQVGAAAAPPQARAPAAAPAPAPEAPGRASPASIRRRPQEARARAPAWARRTCPRRAVPAARHPAAAAASGLPAALPSPPAPSARTRRSERAA